MRGCGKRGSACLSRLHDPSLPAASAARGAGKCSGRCGRSNRASGAPAKSARPPISRAIYCGAMAVIISMLRGVNLAQHHRVKMDALRALYQSLKLRDPQTFIQSGNVLFRTEEKDLARLAARIQKGIETKFGFRSDVILRTVAEMEDVIRRNPFAARRGIDPRKLLVTFLATGPGPETP